MRIQTMKRTKDQGEDLRKNNMGEIVARNVVQRKPNYLYYVDAQGNVCEAKMKHGGKKKEKDKEKKE